MTGWCCQVPEELRVTRQVNRSAVALLIAISVVLTAACSFPGVPKRKAATTSASATAATPIAANIFKAGTVTHSVVFGAQTLVIKYYTTGAPAWNGKAPIPVQFSAHVEGTDGLHAIKLSTFDSTFTTGQATVAIGKDQGPFVITPPFTYGGLLTVPVTQATQAAVLNEFSLLVETAPKSGDFFRDTVVDRLDLTFATSG
ncbi:MAG: hypothetical protein JWM76_3207 [Pseudonocardiales bacterium]|nr:hypothetical protein [Pseudonocardiales bacterium]